MKQTQTVRPYRGVKPFLYVSVAPEDRAAAEGVLLALQNEGYRVYFGTGRFASRERQTLLAAPAVVAFLSPAAFRSPRVMEELETAIAENQRLIAIHLAPVSPPAELRAPLAALQAVLRYGYDEESTFLQKLMASDALKNLRRTPLQKRWLRDRIAAAALAVVLVLLLAAGGLVYAGVNVVRNLSTLSFSEARAEETAPTQTLAPAATPVPVVGSGSDVTQAELGSIESLRIVGDLVLQPSDQYRYDAETGSHFVNGRSVGRGSLAEITDLAQFRGLKNLTLIYQNVADLTPVFALSSLETLVVCDNPVASIEGIQALTHLTRLDLSGTDVTDLTPLRALDTAYAERWQDGLTLTLTRMRISDYAPLAALPRYYALTLDGAPSRWLEDVKRCGCVQNLTCQGVASLSELAGINGLRRLTVSEADAMTSLAGAEKLTELTHLSVSGALTGIGAVGEAPTLTDLTLVGAQLVSLEGIGAFPSIARLDVSGCPAVKSYRPLKTLPALRVLTVASASAKKQAEALRLPSLDVREGGL